MEADICKSIGIQQYSQGFTVAINDEEQSWLSKTNRYPLWFRYAPKHIQDNDLILFAYQLARHKENI